ncbi:hypothetical protein EDB87DRAFT_150771 [Lactarius vividus]|nr:hypothetical protein EDB87DRAFT_150771 [Lactarius vividus]
MCQHLCSLETSVFLLVTLSTTRCQLQLRSQKELASTANRQPGPPTDAFLTMEHLVSRAHFSTYYPNLAALFNSVNLSATRCLSQRSLILPGFPVSCVILFYSSLIRSFP